MSVRKRGTDVNVTRDLKGCALSVGLLGWFFLCPDCLLAVTDFVMRIAVFTDSFLPYICGATFAALNQANELAKRGHKVRVYCPGSTHDQPKTSMSDELHESVSVKTVPFSLPWGGQPDLNVVFPVLWPTMRDLRRFKPDVVHAHTEWGTGWAGVFAARRLRIPLIGTFHTFWDDPRYVRHFPWPNWKCIQRAMGAYSAFFYRQCDVTIAPSASVQAHLKTRGIDATVVSNGIPQPELRPAREIAKRRAALGFDERLTFLYLGRVSYEKSLRVCLEAFKQVLATHPESRFVMIGDGPDMARIKAHARELALGDRVHFTGAIPHEKLMAQNLPLLGDVFITASETENQPVSMLEVMTFGLPAIGPRARGIPELIEEGRNGYLFEPGDVAGLAAHMLAIAESPAALTALRRGAFAVADHHSIMRSAERLETIYGASQAALGGATAGRRSRDPGEAAALRRSA